jgi:dolichol-phosphate mannosyltransferase
MTAPALTVVVPVYNERENFGAWWELARPHLPDGCRVRVVHDHDDDDTLPVVAALAAAGAPVEALRNRGRGVFAAILAGLRSVDRGPVLVSMADLCDDLALVPRMMDEYARGATVVVASRYMPGGRQLGGPWLKGQLARWGSRSLHHLAGFPVHDASNSFRLYDAGFVRGLDLGGGRGFEIGMQITLHAWMAGRSVVEVPCTWRDRTRGESRFRLGRWLPLYGRLWARGMAFGVRGRLGRGGASGGPG